jgi:hypothetical protein
MFYTADILGNCVLPEFIDLILKTWSGIGDEDTPLERVVEIVINDAMAVFADQLRQSMARRRLFDRAVVEQVLGRPLDDWALARSWAAFPQELALATKAKQSSITRSFGVDDMTVVVSTVPTLLVPVASRGAASRVDVWRLLWLTAIGIKVPVVADLLRERRTPRSKERRKAIDEKFLWRLRRRAIKQLAETIAPLLPSSITTIAA